MSIAASKFVLNTVQLSVWPRASSPISQSKFIAPVLRNFSDVFDGDITALPVPSDAPSEMPRSILTSRDGSWRLIGALSRIDSIWTKIDKQAADGQIITKSIDIVLKIIEESNISIGRCAFVVTRVLETATASSTLAKHFCNEKILQGPIKRSENFEIHNHKKYKFELSSEKIDINSWMRCKTAVSLASQSSAILVEQDLNTLQEEVEKREINLATLKEFFSKADDEMRKILSEYFPE